jgi:sugar lactone lactonase YvrE
VLPRALLCCLFAVAAIVPFARADRARQPLDVRLFAHVGNPGQPEGLAVDEHGLAYVGTNQSGKGDARAPSRVFAYAPDGRLLRSYVIEGQDLAADHGIDGLAFDGGGMLYALDRIPARVLRIDPITGRQETYATFRDLPPCGRSGGGHDCSATVSDLPPFVDSLVFAPNGDLYATDLQQDVIWRIPRGGGQAQVFFADPRLESPMGPNGMQFLPDGRTLLFAVTGALPQGPPDSSSGKLYALPVEPGPRAGTLRPFWQSRPADGPDGVVVGQSGRVYVALAGANQLVELSPAGTELARVPSPAENLQRQANGQVPFDNPASVSFEGERILVTNQSYLTGNSANWAVFDVFAGEPGLPLFLPDMGVRAGEPAHPPRGQGHPPRARPRLALRLAYAAGRTGLGSRCARGRVLASVAGSGIGQVRRVGFLIGRRRVAELRTRPFRLMVDPAHGARARRLMARAAVLLAGGGHIRLARAFFACAR